MRNHWSCSKLADWLRGTPKPPAAGIDEWEDWRRLAQGRHPWRYWLAEEGLSHIQDLVLWPSEKLNSIRYYSNNRWVTRTHALTAHPRDIRPGTWCDLGSRFLPCLFNELVDFVEIEMAGHAAHWDKEMRVRYRTPWWQRHWYFRWFAQWRCPEAGLAHLDWAANLVIDESWGVRPGDPDYGKPTHQAQTAQEIRELYFWWKEVRPNRPDAYDESGWTEVCDLARETGSGFSRARQSPEQQRQTTQALDRLQTLEEEYHQEDEDMMIRLIRIRRGLWT